MTTFELKHDENIKAKEIANAVIGEKSWNIQVTTLKKNLPIKCARQIKEWRVNDDDLKCHSWRSIAQLFCEKYPELAEQNNIVNGNQISGIFLCEAAMLKLKETTDQGWN